MNSRPIRIGAFAGRIVGFAIGSLAGPAGAVFGVLAGWMIDQYRSIGHGRYRVQRFLVEPSLERNPEYGSLYGTAALAVVLLTVSSYPSKEVVRYLLGERRPIGKMRSRFGGRLRRAVPTIPHGVFDLCLIERHRIDLPETLTALRRCIAAGQERVLLDLLVRTLAVRGVGIDCVERSILERTARMFRLTRTAVVQLEEQHGCLSKKECESLGVGRDSGRRVIKREYRALVAQLHPDTASSLDGKQREMMQQAFLRVQEAYDSLMRQHDERESRASESASNPIP